MILPSVARDKLITFFRYHTKDFQIKFHHIRITESKVIHVLISISNWEKTNKWEKFSGFQDSARRGLQIRAVFRDYKLGKKGLQNRGSFRNFKSRQTDYKLGQGFQIKPKRFQIEGEIRNCGKKDFKSGQGLQIGAEHVSEWLLPCVFC